MYESERSSSSEDERPENVGDEAGKKGKRRVRNPEKWCNKKAKFNRNSGKQYVSASKTKKQFGSRPSCGEKCRIRCSTKIDDTARDEIFSAHWNLGCLQTKGKENLLSIMQIQSNLNTDILVHKTLEA